jgi:hypothetical protein
MVRVPNDFTVVVAVFIVEEDTGKAPMRIS